MTIQALKDDPVGQASWLDREAEALPAYHWARELVQNSFDAGAEHVRFDSYVDERGRRLARCSDDGTGMTEAELQTHAQTLHLSGKNRDDNYGVGGRLATLTNNPSGVTWASCAWDDDGDATPEAMVMLKRERGRYGINVWQFSDGTRGLVASPELHMLDRTGETGTAVILHGDGRHHTWSSSVAYGVDSFLSRRYFRLPGEVIVDYDDADTSAAVIPYGDRLELDEQAHGQVTVDSDGSVAYWWTLEPTEDRLGGKVKLTAAIGARVGDELFDMVAATERRTRYMNFGIVGRTARSRVAIIIVPGFEVAMATGRATLQRAGGEPLPWDSWAQCFIDELPDEIRILNKAVVTDTELDEKFLAQLTPEWWKLVNATPARVPDPEGDMGFAPRSEQLITTAPEPAGGDEPGESSVGSVQPPRRRDEGHEGSIAGKERKAHRLPSIVPLSDEEWTEDLALFAVYSVLGNQIFLRENAEIFDVVTDRFVAEFPHFERESLRAIVVNSYGVEAAAKVVHTLGMVRHGWMPDWVDQAFSPEGLSASLLGLHAIDRMVRDNCRQLR